MSATDAVARMLVLVPWLLQRPGAHVDEVADALGTDRRTVLRDLAALEFCGLPGRLGGELFEVELTGERVVLRLAPAFDRPLRPTPAEALRLVLALDQVATALGDELPALEGAVAALRRAAGVPAGVVPAGDDATRWLGPLRDAVARRGRVRMAYDGRAGRSRRVVEPWQLVLHAGSWYLHAHDVDAEGHRIFRLDRVEELQDVDGEASAPRPGGDLPLPAWQPGPDALAVDLRVAPAGRWVLEHLDGVEERGEDLVRVSTDALGWLLGLVVAAAGDVEVVDPPHVRQALVARVRAALAAHPTP